jgi:chromosome partitioning protein
MFAFRTGAGSAKLPRMPRIIAVANLKGGVGKTTLAVSLACQFAATAQVHLVDADPQGTALEWYRDGNLPLFAEARPLRDGAGTAAWINAVTASRAELVVIDLPPSGGDATVAAMAVADLVLLPCTPSVLDERATWRAVSALRQARQARRGGRPVCLLVPNRVDRRLLAGRRIERELQAFGELVGPAVGLRSAFIEAAAANSWVGAFAPGSAAHAEIGALAAAVDRLCRAAEGAAPRGAASGGAAPDAIRAG